MTWLAVALNMLGLYLLGNRRRVGFLLGIAAETIWLIWSATLEVYALSAMSTIYICLAMRAWVKWSPTT